MDLRTHLSNLIEDYEKHIYIGPPFDPNILNVFIQKHEYTLVAHGLFLHGIRVKTEGLTQPHENFAGVLGIVSLSIKVIKNKLNQPI